MADQLPDLNLKPAKAKRSRKGVTLWPKDRSFLSIINSLSGMAVLVVLVMSGNLVAVKLIRSPNKEAALEKARLESLRLGKERAAAATERPEERPQYDLSAVGALPSDQKKKDTFKMSYAYDEADAGQEMPTEEAQLSGVSADDPDAAAELAAPAPTAGSLMAPQELPKIDNLQALREQAQAAQAAQPALASVVPPPAAAAAPPAPGAGRRKVSRQATSVQSSFQSGGTGAFSRKFAPMKRPPAGSN